MAWSIHESINSLGIVVTAVLAIYSIVEQKGSEELVIRTSQKDFTSTVDATEGAYVENGTAVPVIGPVSWNFEVYNPSDKPVTITEHSVYLLSDEGMSVMYTSMNDVISYQADASKSFQVPLQLGPRAVEKLRLSLSLPIFPTDSQRNTCLGEPGLLVDVEHCFILKGTDFFGNSMKVETELFPGMKSHTFQGPLEGPSFLLELKSGDGSSHRTSFSYY